VSQEGFEVIVIFSCTKVGKPFTKTRFCSKVIGGLECLRKLRFTLSSQLLKKRAAVVRAAGGMAQCGLSFWKSPTSHLDFV